MSPLFPTQTLLPDCWQFQPIHRGWSIILNCSTSEQKEKLLIVVLAKFSEGHSCQAGKLQEKSFSGCEDGDFEQVLPCHVVVKVWHSTDPTSHCRLSEPLLEPASS